MIILRRYLTEQASRRIYLEIVKLVMNHYRVQLACENSNVCLYSTAHIYIQIHTAAHCTTEVRAQTYALT